MHCAPPLTDMARRTPPWSIRGRGRVHAFINIIYMQHAFVHHGLRWSRSQRRRCARRQRQVVKQVAFRIRLVAGGDFGRAAAVNCTSMRARNTWHWALAEGPPGHCLLCKLVCICVCIEERLAIARPRMHSNESNSTGASRQPRPNARISAVVDRGEIVRLALSVRCVSRRPLGRPGPRSGACCTYSAPVSRAGPIYSALQICNMICILIL